MPSIERLTVSAGTDGAAAEVSVFEEDTAADEDDGAAADEEDEETEEDEEDTAYIEDDAEGVTLTADLAAGAAQDASTVISSMTAASMAALLFLIAITRTNKIRPPHRRA